MDLCKEYYNGDIPNDVLTKAIQVQADITRLVNEDYPVTEAEYKANFIKENHLTNEAILIWSEIVHQGFYFAKFIKDNPKYHINEDAEC